MIRQWCCYQILLLINTCFDSDELVFWSWVHSLNIILLSFLMIWLKGPQNSKTTNSWSKSLEKSAVWSSQQALSPVQFLSTQLLHRVCLLRWKLQCDSDTRQLQISIFQSTKSYSKQTLKQAFNSSQQALPTSQIPAIYPFYHRCCSLKTVAAITKTPSKIFTGET